MYSYSLLANYILVYKNITVRPKFFGHISAKKIKNFIWRHFCSPKKWEKAFSFFNKNVLSLRPQTGRDSFFLSYCGILSTFFSLMVWQNWLECVRNIPLHSARIILKLIILMFLMAASGSEMNSLYLSWSMYVINQSHSYQSKSLGTYLGT